MDKTNCWKLLVLKTGHQAWNFILEGARTLSLTK